MGTGIEGWTGCCEVPEDLATSYAWRSPGKLPEERVFELSLEVYKQKKTFYRKRKNGKKAGTTS